MHSRYFCVKHKKIAFYFSDIEKMANFAHRNEQ